ncbi:MAG: sodium-dependent transporter [Deltaproteobacteria bacterium]|nr:sodium-dependent transporter [Deltaproteobacteria bacterium]
MDHLAASSTEVLAPADLKSKVDSPIQRDPAQRGQWSRLGFVFAASGSAIGLGNIVFFPANAYRYGGGAFYLPYLVALFTVGIPLLILELGLGHQQRRAYPAALRQVAGRKGEFLGWWALVNTSIITLYYVAILAWVIGMFVGSWGPLWKPLASLTGFQVESLANPQGFFFQLVSSWRPLGFAMVVWSLNAAVVWRGAAGIERAVKIFVPAMWLLMLVLVFRGITLPGGEQGVWSLFEPNLEAMADVSVWRGAFSQIFFTLSIGFGVMTAYGSYLPKRSDQANNSLLIACLNCGFEYIAGIAIFAMLFSFAVVPQASTIAMSFFVVPQGIAQLPGGEGVVTSFGAAFFLLLLLAGLSSTVSLVESLVAALEDKFSVRRRSAVLAICALGIVGSATFTLPQVVNPGLENNGTLGLTLLDLVDHWVFGYGLLVVGLSQCLLLGQKHRIESLRAGINRQSRWRLGPWYGLLIRWFIPGILVVILLTALVQEIRGGLYGMSYGDHLGEGYGWLAGSPLAALGLWLVLPAAIAWGLTRRRPNSTGGR